LIRFLPEVLFKNGIVLGTTQRSADVDARTTKHQLSMCMMDISAWQS